MWTSKYRPSSLSDIVGNSDQVDEVREWGMNWSSDDPAIIIYGPPGLGKTSIAHVLAEEMSWEVLEMNASDKRTKDIVKSIAGESSKTATLSAMSQKLIIIDESDNLHGHADRGGKRAITDVIKESEQPIILIANDFYELSRSLRNNVKSVEFNRVDNSELAKLLRDICESEGVEYETEALKEIAKNADGDIRGAVNDLQKHALKGFVRTDDIQQHSRDKKEEIFPFIDDTLKSGDPKAVRNKSENLDMTPYDLYRWIEQNIYYEYDSEELRGGIKQVSKASVWLGIVNETQNYKYWRYASDRLTGGVASERTGNHSGWTRWQPPRYGGSATVSDDLMEKITERINISQDSVRDELYPYINYMIEYCKPEDLTAQFSAWYDLDESDISEITGSGESTNKVERVVDNGEEIRNDFEIEIREEPSGSIDPTDYEDKDDGKDRRNNESDAGDEDDSEDQTGLEDFM